MAISALFMSEVHYRHLVAEYHYMAKIRPKIFYQNLWKFVVGKVFHTFKTFFGLLSIDTLDFSPTMNWSSKFLLKFLALFWPHLGTALLVSTHQNQKKLFTRENVLHSVFNSSRGDDKHVRQGRNICFKQLQRLEDCEFRPKPYELGTHPYVRKGPQCENILIGHMYSG